MSRTKGGFIEFKNENKNNLVIFIHGFQGDAYSTWNDFVELIKILPEFNDWDILSFNYPTSIKPRIIFWSRDPNLETLSKYFVKRLIKKTRYEKIILIAHSMGGLVVQCGLIEMSNNNSDFLEKIKHVFLFGTPSNGLLKARIFWLWKRQIKDMAIGSRFIKQLRQDWQDLFNDHPPFNLKAIAGLNDSFVMDDTCHSSFHKDCWDWVQGNHLEIVKPIPARRDSIDLVITDMTGKQVSIIAPVESRLFHRIVKEYLPNWSERDDEEIVDLALALEVLGERKEAERILDERMKISPDTDIKGVRAGRLKRSWLLYGNDDNAEKAYDLYCEAYQISSMSNDEDQALYNGINVAFMELIYKKNKESSIKIATEVLGYCKNKKNPDKWSLATEGEIYLYLGETSLGLKKYKQAIHKKHGANPREIISMYDQALIILEELKDDKGKKQLDKIFHAD